MRILANENIPQEAVEALRQKGHDVAWIRTLNPGISDRHILELAQAEDRILVTFDKDFGELAYRFKLPASSGIILFRISGSSPADLVEKIISALENRSDWAGHFSVIEEARIRMILLPRLK